MKSRVVVVACAASGFISLLCGGCVIQGPRVGFVAPAPAVVVTGDVEVVEPPPDDRVYIYDTGYPPGCYLYGGFYFYGGRRYTHDVFVRDIVTVNIREHRYVNVEENRRAGERIKVQHATEYKKTGGHPQAGKPAHPVEKAPAKGSKDSKESKDKDKESRQ
ncbi:MAG: hypothetical protein ABSA67_14365 [Candidatus Brocadiia bacterium]|jgi:hypothetical protein